MELNMTNQKGHPASWWHAHVPFKTAQPFSEDVVDELLEALTDYSASLSFARDLRGGAVSLSVEADTPLAAADQASSVVTTKATPILGDLILTGIEVMSEEAMDEYLATPTFPEVVGYAEIADMAGVSRQRARQFATLKGFPKPVIDTAQGPLMGKFAVERWLETRNTATGRPRKELTHA